ncbi:MAG: cytochrome C oxidase subunit IV family protein [Isosphaeraceae bacterium]
MADAPVLSTDMAEELEAESHAPYMKIWFILAVLTGVEWVYAYLFKDYFGLLVGGLVGVALIKAGMVGWYFMHLKFEKKWVYILIVPACVMAVFLTLMLVPDMAMKPTVDENFLEEEEESWVVPPPASDTQPVLRLASRSFDGLARRVS